jgi:SAM-dependent methyltransferase
MTIMPVRHTTPELLDLPAQMYSREELEGTLADIRVVNRFLGDTAAVLKHLSIMTGKGGDALRVLDLATGSADIPQAIVDWARKRSLPIRVTALDANPQTVEVARQRSNDYPELELIVGDALNLPFPEKSFDIVLCSKTIHHFREDQVVRLLQEAARVARRGYIVMDLRRSWIAYLLIRLLTRLCTGNRLTRYDGPLSVLRAFTPAELAALARSAGLSGFRVVGEPFWRIVLTGEVA